MTATHMPIMDIDEEDEDVSAVNYAQIDLIRAAEQLTTHEARFVVDFYYQNQERRKAAASQARSMAENNEPNILTGWVQDEMRRTENHIKKYLDSWSDQSVVGRWSKEIVGVGPVLAAGLLAHIDIHKAPHVSHIYSYAGLDPTQEWLGKDRAANIITETLGSSRRPITDDDLIVIANATGRVMQRIKAGALTEDGTITRTSLKAALARRPWNADLKTLCWKIGDCIVKFSNHPKSFYGPIYKQRKEREIEMNLSGGYREKAAQILATKNFSRDTTAKKRYEAGMLPDAHIHARASRFAVKVFLAHWHHVAFETEFARPASLPYVVRVLGHEDYIMPPNYDALPNFTPVPPFRTWP